jgi:IS1 family transposase
MKTPFRLRIETGPVKQTGEPECLHPTAFYHGSPQTKDEPMANVLPREKQLLCLKMLAEGSSIRSTERTMQVHRDTIMRLMVQFGERCETFLDRSLRGLELRHLEIDEQWTWVAKKQARITTAEHESGLVGDQYLFLAIDQDTKLIAAHKIGKRTEETTRRFLADLACRIVLPEDPNVDHNTKPQFSTDGFNAYPNAILDIYGSTVQHGVIIKNYADEEMGRYAPPEVVGCDRRRMQYVDDLWTICTSHAERFNCTTRQWVKRFCRLTLAFSKKLRNLQAAVSMHIAAYNFTWRPAKTDPMTGKVSGRRVTPAMAAGVVDRLWTFMDLYDVVMAG